MAKSKVATPSSSSKVFVLILIGAGLALVIGLAAGTFGETTSKIDTRNKLIDNDTVQAVQLVNGTTYFGNIGFSGDTVVIENAYYVDDVDAEASKANLVEHGTEAYQPVGTINVNYQLVLSWENLQDDSIVTQTILDNSSGE